ncbi:MAG: hypothetical protein ACK4NY_12225 [Spirosomataceae bacterium]
MKTKFILFNLLILSFSDVLAQNITIRPGKIDADDNNSETVFLRSTSFPSIIGVKLNGTFTNPTNVTNNQLLLSIEGRGYGGNSISSMRAGIRMYSTQNWTTNNQGSRMEFFSNKNGEASFRSRIIINDDGKVGVGEYWHSLNFLPDHQFEVQQPTDSDKGVAVYRYGGDAPSYFGISARGNNLLPTATQINNILARFGGKGHDATGFTTARARIDMLASENWTSTATGAELKFYTTQSGTTTTTAKMTIQANGNVGIGDESPNVKLRVNGDVALDCPEGYIEPNISAFERNGRSILYVWGEGRDFHGITDGKEGVIVHLIVQGGIQIINESTTVNPKDRIITGGTFTSPNETISGTGGCTLIWDHIYERWRIIGIQK